MSGVLTVNVRSPLRRVEAPAALLISKDPAPDVPALANVVSAVMDSVFARMRAVPLSKICAPARVNVPVPRGPLVRVPFTTVLSAAKTNEPALKAPPPEKVLLPAPRVSIPVPDLIRATVPAIAPVPPRV